MVFQWNHTWFSAKMLLESLQMPGAFQFLLF